MCVLWTTHPCGHEGPCPAKGASHDGRSVMYTHQDKVMAGSSDKFLKMSTFTQVKKKMELTAD